MNADYVIRRISLARLRDEVVLSLDCGPGWYRNVDGHGWCLYCVEERYGTQHSLYCYSEDPRTKWQAAATLPTHNA